MDQMTRHSLCYPLSAQAVPSLCGLRAQSGWPTPAPPTGCFQRPLHSCRYCNLGEVNLRTRGLDGRGQAQPTCFPGEALASVLRLSPGRRPPAPGAMAFLVGGLGCPRDLAVTGPGPPPRGA